jgi:hypothetical protein
MYQCATVCESIRVKSARNAFFQRTNDTRFDDCTNIPGFPKTPPIITRLFLQEEKKKVRSVVLGGRADAGVWQTNVGREAHSEAPLRDGGSVETGCFNRKRE